MDKYTGNIFGRILPSVLTPVGCLGFPNTTFNIVIAILEKRNLSS